MKPTITAFESAPDRGRGFARDMRVRWALEEVGQPYDAKLLSFKELKQEEHRKRNPFGQIPTFEDGGLVLFESGAIVFHVAQHHEGLLPGEPMGRARVIAWMFSALNTVEPPVNERGLSVLFEQDKPWFTERLPGLEEKVRLRLGALSAYLASDRWLESTFTAADLLMVSVLRRLTGTDLLNSFPNLVDYVIRAEDRDAFQRAFAAQREVFNRSRTSP